MDVFGLYLDAIALRIRSAGKVTSVPVLGVVAILADGQKQLVALELCGGESFDAWKGCLDDIVTRGLGAPVVCVIDGHAGLRQAVGLVWPETRACAAPRMWPSAFLHGVGVPEELSFAAQYPACTSPCQRFACVLTDAHA